MSQEYRARENGGENGPEFTETAQVFSQAYLAKAIDDFDPAALDTGGSANGSEFTMPSGQVQIQGTYLRGAAPTADFVFAPTIGTPASAVEINRDGAYDSNIDPSEGNPKNNFGGAIYAYNGLEVPIRQGDMVTVINVDGVHTICSVEPASTPFCFFQVESDASTTDSGCVWSSTITEILGTPPTNPVDDEP